MSYIGSLKHAIKEMHDCDSKHIESKPITEVFQGETVWDGSVEVFKLLNHPKAKRCYAWSHKENDKDTRFICVLEIPPVDSPQSAVKAAIISESKN